MNKTNIANILLDNLKSKNITISSEEAEGIAKKIRKPMWDWHLYIGYLLTGLYLLRIAYIAIKGIQFKNPFNPATPAKQKLQSWIYILFYIFLGITLLTGLPLGLRILDEYRGQIGSIHKLSLYFFVIFLILHLAGIFLGEKTTEKGVVSAMINGGDEK